ncbi:MAG TPA: hypothetical protein VIV11_43305 [Kofleriaceae bacterium]
MPEAVPEPIFPEDDPYPAYRVPAPIVARQKVRSPIDEYVLSAVVATGTVLVKNQARRVTEI